MILEELAQKRKTLMLFVFLFLLAACAHAVTETPTTLPASIETIAPTRTPEADSQATQPLMRFTFPTPGAEPISSWRPPLYPVPWALSPVDHFYFTRPIAADQINWPDPTYRYGGVFFEDIKHTGIDIPADEFTPVLAAGPGTVIWAGWGLYSGDPRDTNDPYGQAVVIQHDFGYQGKPLYTTYAHLSEIDVTRGQWLDTGDQLGLVGDTGATTGPHLHFEIRLGQDSFFETLNPELWLSPPQGWGVLVGRITNGLNLPLEGWNVYVWPVENETNIWYTRTYGDDPDNEKSPLQSDPYYHENYVLSDLPAGDYVVDLDFGGIVRRHYVTIYPGQVTYFRFRGPYGYSDTLPRLPGMEALTPTPRK